MEKLRLQLDGREATPDTALAAEIMAMQADARSRLLRNSVPTQILKKWLADQTLDEALRAWLETDLETGTKAAAPSDGARLAANGILIVVANDSALSPFTDQGNPVSSVPFLPPAAADFVVMRTGGGFVD